MIWQKKFGLLACLYIAQGLPYGFFTQALPALLRSQGISLEVIGFSTILVLPWALKFLWAPLVDKWGTRRIWILGANFSAVASILIISTFELNTLASSTINILFISFFLLNLFTATQDIATDGLAVTKLNSDERGIGNGIQVAGYRVGMILSGGLLLAWFTDLGWQYSMWILAALILLFSLPIIFSKDVVHTEAQDQLELKDFLAFAKQPQIGLWLLIIICYKFGDYFAGTMVRPLLVDIGLKLEDIAVMVGSVGFAAGLLGALLGGYWVRYLGRYRALLYYCLIQAVAASSWFIVTLGFDDVWLLYLLSFFEYFSGGLTTAALFTVMMDHCRAECASSDYTIQSCIVVLMNVVSSSISGISAAGLGYQQHFLLSGLLSLIAVPLILKYKKNFI